MIVPTIGRIVLVRNRLGSMLQYEPEAAMVCYVHLPALWPEYTVVVAGHDHQGEPFRGTFRLLQGTAEENARNHWMTEYAEWMPYQKAVAAGQPPTLHAIHDPKGAG
jgi:hypothetical protein